MLSDDRENQAKDFEKQEVKNRIQGEEEQQRPAKTV